MYLKSCQSKCTLMLKLQHSLMVALLQVDEVDFTENIGHVIDLVQILSPSVSVVGHASAELG